MATETGKTPIIDDLGFDAHVNAGNAKARPAAGPPAEFKQPPVELGDVVLWGPDQNSAPTSMALVTRVYPGTVDLAVLAAGMHNFMPYDGCRHYDHPDANAVRQTGAGVWCHKNSRAFADVGLSKLAIAFASLSARVESLEGAATAPARGEAKK